MQAAYVERLGPPDEIRIGELPVPVPAPTEVLVVVELVAAKPVDTFVRSGRYPTVVTFPFVLGRDLVGIVEACGSGSAFRVGERVWANSLDHDGRQGTFAAYAAVPAERCYRLPDGVDPELAVAAAHPAATAYLAWFVHAGMHAGQCVYVAGGAGNVGSSALAMARRAGARVLASAKPADHDRYRAAGADVVVDYRDPALAEQLREAAPGGVDVFWDTSGHHDLDLAAGVVAPGGRILLTAGAGARPELPLGQLYTRDISLPGFVISRATVSRLADAARLVNLMLAAGELDARVTETLPLSATAEVHARLEAGQVRGRVLVRP